MDKFTQGDIWKFYEKRSHYSFITRRVHDLYDLKIDKDYYNDFYCAGMVAIECFFDESNWFVVSEKKIVSRNYYNYFSIFYSELIRCHIDLADGPLWKIPDQRAKINLISRDGRAFVIISESQSVIGRMSQLLNKLIQINQPF